MTGDIDSRATDVVDGTSDAPGANDNASGMAGVIEAARVLTRDRFPTSIVYAGLAGEEQRRLFGGEVDGPSRQLARYVDRMVQAYMPNLDAIMI